MNISVQQRFVNEVAAYICLYSSYYLSSDFPLSISSKKLVSFEQEVPLKAAMITNHGTKKTGHQFIANYITNFDINIIISNIMANYEKKSFI